MEIKLRNTNRKMISHMDTINQGILVLLATIPAATKIEVT